MFQQFFFEVKTDEFHRHNIIKSYRIQDKGRGSVITTEDGEKILVRESNRYITNELKRIGWVFL